MSEPVYIIDQIAEARARAADYEERARSSPETWGRAAALAREAVAALLERQGNLPVEKYKAEFWEMVAREEAQRR